MQSKSINELIEQLKDARQYQCDDLVQDLYILATNVTALIRHRLLNEALAAAVYRHLQQHGVQAEPAQLAPSPAAAAPPLPPAQLLLLCFGGRLLVAHLVLEEQRPSPNVGFVLALSRWLQPLYHHLRAQLDTAAGGASERDLGRQCLATVLQGLAALFSVLLRHRQAVLRSGRSPPATLALAHPSPGAPPATLSAVPAALVPIGEVFDAVLRQPAEMEKDMAQELAGAYLVLLRALLYHIHRQACPPRTGLRRWLPGVLGGPVPRPPPTYGPDPPPAPPAPSSPPGPADEASRLLHRWLVLAIGALQGPHKAVEPLKTEEVQADSGTEGLIDVGTRLQQFHTALQSSAPLRQFLGRLRLPTAEARHADCVADALLPEVLCAVAQSLRDAAASAGRPADHPRGQFLSLACAAVLSQALRSDPALPASSTPSPTVQSIARLAAECVEGWTEPEMLGASRSPPPVAAACLVTLAPAIPFVMTSPDCAALQPQLRPLVEVYFDYVHHGLGFAAPDSALSSRPTWWWSEAAGAAVLALEAPARPDAASALPLLGVALAELCARDARVSARFLQRALPYCRFAYDVACAADGQVESRSKETNKEPEKGLLVQYYQHLTQSLPPLAVPLLAALGGASMDQWLALQALDAVAAVRGFFSERKGLAHAVLVAQCLTSVVSRQPDPQGPVDVGGILPTAAALARPGPRLPQPTLAYLSTLAEATATLARQLPVRLVVERVAPLTQHLMWHGGRRGTVVGLAVQLQFLQARLPVAVLMVLATLRMAALPAAPPPVARHLAAAMPAILRHLQDIKELGWQGAAENYAELCAVRLGDLHAPTTATPDDLPGPSPDPDPNAIDVLSPALAFPQFQADLDPVMRGIVQCLHRLALRETATTGKRPPRHFLAALVGLLQVADDALRVPLCAAVEAVLAASPDRALPPAVVRRCGTAVRRNPHDATRLALVAWLLPLQRRWGVPIQPPKL